MQSTSTYQTGLQAEELAAQHLQNNGYNIIGLRHKTKEGEIDIVAEQPATNTLVMVEVKSRKTPYLTEDIITKKQKQRIMNATLMFLADNERYSTHNIRFDFMYFCANKLISHIEGAWHE